MLKHFACFGRRLTIWSGLFAVLFGLGTLPRNASAQDASCDTITVSSHSNYPPYSYLKNDVLEGAAIELVKLIGRDIGDRKSVV